MLDELSVKRSNATLEVDDFVDPQTGERFSLEFSPEHYWISPGGTIVGPTCRRNPTSTSASCLESRASVQPIRRTPGG